VRALRVVLTVERYAPAIGGAERVVQRLGEGLAQRGHDVLVVTSGRRSSERINEVRVERFEVRGNAARGIRGDLGPVFELVDAFAPHVVVNYAAQTWHTDSFATLLDQARDYKLVLAPCGFSALDDPLYAGYFAQLGERLAHYDALVFHSAIYRDWEFATAAGTPAALMHVIPNAADDPVLRHAHAGTETLFVTVGSHVRSKGHGEFIRAVGSIGRRLEARGLVVAPPRRGFDFARGCQPRCFLESLRPKRAIRFVDGRPAATVARVLSAADVFLFPSHVECAPVVILEAMAAGVPWVSYAVGNVRELAGGVVVDGFDELVDAGTELARAPEERERLGEAGRRAWRDRHRWPEVIDSYERLLLGLADAAPVGAMGAGAR
jgi:glycosyltransferase involved in cell wall biosynthesis